MRPQSSVGFVETYVQAQKCGPSYVKTPFEARVMPAPTSKRPEEREFAVNSGASVHMMSKKDLSSYELDTLQESRNPHNGA